MCHLPQLLHGVAWHVAWVAFALGVGFAQWLMGCGEESISWLAVWR